MRARGITDKTDAAWVEVKVGGLGPHELNGCLNVVSRGRISARLPEPVVDSENRVTGAREKQAPISVERLAADLPAAAVNRDQDRRFAAALGQIEIADQFSAVVLGINDVSLARRFVFSVATYGC